jgi:hypothetical protein
MFGLCVVSRAMMSVLDGLWRPVLFLFCVMRGMSAVMGECVLQYIVCGHFACFVVFFFAGGVVDKLVR